ncbi:c-type cytochrome biogenesis protein CcmI [Pseudolysobacter antarcticus]|uniref:C-type cytochrome biogenesis protein CcmI n=1 Tax=Pseudolysobacter antarcticus TaxID=2511995 RepID=A0A411HKT7_9GAMM|nr:c-type cytochrome biogenesis protein CcmI [Pseudolysobacter antarcticus]QBB71139.1 c-type cytochrome biogenesis protein CcmI [Pseudolysobacter antarcticus]
MTLFVVIAALMLIFALACVLIPLVRSGQANVDPATLARRRLKVLDDARANEIISAQEYTSKREVLAQELLSALEPKSVPRSRAAQIAILVVALLLPASAIVLYRILGQPLALDAQAVAALSKPATDSPEAQAADMQQAIAGLAAKLQLKPDDAEGWTLLGRAYKSTERFAEARDALKHASDLQPEQPDTMIEYAEALALASESRHIGGEPRVLLERALKLDPQNQRGLWLLGIGDYQQGKFASAIATWNGLLVLLPKDSEVANSVKQQIAEAQSQLSGTAIPAPAAIGEPAKNSTATKPSATENTTANAVAPKLTVHVVLDAKLKDQLAPGATLFIYAKAVSGPPMPLAIQRLRADQLPITITLDDSMAMMPSMKLSLFPQVVVGARISKSGNAIAQSGDLQTLSKPLPITQKEGIELSIDQVVP